MAYILIKRIGLLFGILSLAIQKAVLANWKYVRALILVYIGSRLVIMPAEKYWIEHATEVPSVPASFILAILISSFFMLMVATAVYACSTMIRQAVSNERTFVINGASAPADRSQARYGIPKNKRFSTDPTEGTFIPAGDEKLWAAEQFDILAKQGILHDSDMKDLDIETLAKEIGLEQIMKERGRTE